MTESPERSEGLGRILMEYRLRAENAPSHAYGWALNEIESLYCPAPEHGWSAEMAKALPCGHTQAQHFYAEDRALKLEPCEFSRPADAAEWKALAESSAHNETMLNDALAQEVKAVRKWKELAERLFEEHEHDDMALERRCNICKLAREVGLKVE